MKTPLIDAIRAKDKHAVIHLLNCEDAHAVATEKDQFARSPLYYSILLKYDYDEVLETYPIEPRHCKRGGPMETIYCSLLCAKIQ